MFRSLTLIAILLALTTILTGTLVRLADAGLGCTDWPRCGIGLSDSEVAAFREFASLHFHQAPDWIATVHRRVALSLLGVLLLLTLVATRIRVHRGQVFLLLSEALALVVIQGWLGTWVVKLQLEPLAVTAHLALAFLMLAILQRLYLVVGPELRPESEVRGLLQLSRLVLIVLMVQVLLGGWLSSHYATYSCPDFPTCQGSWWPEVDFVEAFRLSDAIGRYPWTLLSTPARTAMAMSHRIVALLWVLMAGGLALGVILNPKVRSLRRSAWLLLALIVINIVVGAQIVMLRMPLPVSLAHTATAALMFLIAIRLHYLLGQPPLPAHVRQTPDVAPARPAALPGSSAAEAVPPPSMPVPVSGSHAEPTPLHAERLFTRLRNQLGKTRGGLTGVLASLALGRRALDQDLLDDVEAQLLMADLGVAATQDIIDHLKANLDRHELDDPATLAGHLKNYLYDILKPVSAPLVIPEEVRPYVILVVGVNGVGKTTTIGKLARRMLNNGHNVMLAAGDTFRAAAVEQLQTWGERNGVPVIAQQTGADSASVIYDAVQAAQARGVDVLIADTAGRLHTKSNLMEELSKIKRIMARLDSTAPHEVLLVLDAGTGQNALNQARQFNEAVGLTGLALTKLDGTAKGGVIFALAKQFGIPIRFIGIGETIDDLQDFDARNFIEALFAE